MSAKEFSKLEVIKKAPKWAFDPYGISRNAFQRLLTEEQIAEIQKWHDEREEHITSAIDELDSDFIALMK